ncbi:MULTISPECIES: hypothetical protein [Bacillus]|uniref:Uncharacterized protein n=1 Tax=Bacillus subtilis TaxID=1423 RepID=A0AAQ3ESK2_BACIU|nr:MULTISPECIES: hypothetical protein [Bacillus]KDE21695.1 hypothetical protein EF83_22310 [Bacillus subtilis]KIN34404.1 hypothetical protein B4071_2100 [Bacillus subtilis]MBO3767113.1 hypothetical protein [Bacillus subtilis]MDP8528064.1 hypothetical protein [Bacillus subtilis]NDJ99866.1 hypothetical protein [Bacillus subtilis subsp. subtilis]
MNYQEDLQKYLEVITGKNFIESAAYIEAQKMLIITYYKSFEEAVAFDQNLSKTSYLNYFTQSKIEKLIVEESARLLRKYPFVEIIAIDLSFNGENYNAQVTREKFNSLTGTEIETLSLENGSWQEFQKKFSSGVKNANRNALFKEFLLK